MFTFYLVCVIFTRGITWLKDSFVSLHLLCLLHCLNVVFPASVSRCFSWGALLGLLRLFQPMNHRRRWKRWPPKLLQSTVHGVIYRCHCVTVSIYQFLHNLQEGWKLNILLFRVNQSVGVMADKCFSCCCLMLLFYKGEKCQSFPFFHLRSQPCFYLIFLI